jgi:hypothetical protein
MPVDGLRFRSYELLIIHFHSYGVGDSPVETLLSAVECELARGTDGCEVQSLNIAYMCEF